MVHRRCSRQIHHGDDKYIMKTLCLLFVSKHVSVSLLFAGFKKCTCPLVFTSKILGEASQFFIMLVPPSLICHLGEDIIIHKCRASRFCCRASGFSGHLPCRTSSWLPNQNYWYLVTQTSSNPPCFPPMDHRDSTQWLENSPNEQTI